MAEGISSKNQAGDFNFRNPVSEGDEGVTAELGNLLHTPSKEVCVQLNCLAALMERNAMDRVELAEVKKFFDEQLKDLEKEIELFQRMHQIATEAEAFQRQINKQGADSDTPVSAPVPADTNAEGASPLECD